MLKPISTKANNNTANPNPATNQPAMSSPSRHADKVHRSDKRKHEMERYAPYSYYIISPQPKTIRVKCPDITKTGITPTLTGKNYNKPPWLNLLTLSQHQPPWTLSIGNHKAHRPHPHINNTTYITQTKIKPTNNNWAHPIDTNNKAYADTIPIIH
jgi:hypothetical protein